ncbi:hypothetical protein FIBSPDRAFT_65889 [Athelia psychrophila]|uniref:Uncharacterized protein n=1 Tax=Athelia psychrophila TaxID=1759441 RepID=A0A167SY63_9AGAM|nr:hypothetical protein FIBSPDRAFT_65889 [Fibularhizoctonia sp. CBS 109695]
MYQLVEQNWQLPGVRTITWAYSIFAIVNVVLFLVAYSNYSTEKNQYEKRVVIWPLILLAALITVASYTLSAYANWVIAVILNDIDGVPKALADAAHFAWQSGFTVTLITSISHFAGSSLSSCLDIFIAFMMFN